MDKYIKKQYNRLGSIIEDIQRIRKDLENVPYPTSKVTSPDAPDDVTLEDLFRAVQYYSKLSASKLKNALIKNNITSISELTKLRPRDLKQFKSVGINTIYHTREAMEDLGILW